MKDRIYEYLDGRSAGSEEIAVEVLKLKGASGMMADKVVEAAVFDDTRFARYSNGFWYLKPSERDIHKIAFISMGLKFSGDVGDPHLVALAASRFMTTGPQSPFGETRVRGETETAGFMAFSRFRKDAIPIGFRLSGTLKAINRVGRKLTGEPSLDEGICLFRLGRLLFPDQPISSLEKLADAVGRTYVTDRDCEGEARFQAEIFLHLVDRLGEEPGTLEQLMSSLYLESEPLDFEAYAFDERYLGDLPQDPGVYVMRDQNGTVIYVGKSVNLRERVGSYFARRASRSEKTKGILDRIWSVEVVVVGSELEALLQEARLIADSKPEFNTQIEVHNRENESSKSVHFILLLPSADPECIELFCVRTGRGIDQVRIRSDLADWETSQNRISRFFFDQIDPAAHDVMGRDLEILKRWMRKYREEVNWVDMDDRGDIEGTMQVLQDFVRGFESEGWEKVWRV